MIEIEICRFAAFGDAAAAQPFRSPRVDVSAAPLASQQVRIPLAEQQPRPTSAHERCRHQKRFRTAVFPRFGRQGSSMSRVRHFHIHIQTN